MCIPLPEVTLPVLGLGLSIAPPAFDDPEFDVDLCCKFHFVIPLPPIPLPPLVFNASTAALMAAASAAIQNYVDRIPHRCPLE